MNTLSRRNCETEPKTAEQINRMRKAGLYVWHALQIAKANVKPGITTGEIDRQIERFFDDIKAVSLFKGFPGIVPYPAVTCISVNEEVVHGIPGKKKLEEGDIVSVDTGCKVLDLGSKTLGWCGDAAATFPVGDISEEARRLIDVTRQVLQLAIDEIPKCNLWSEVGRKMEEFVKRYRFSVVESHVGHGIGRELHEVPQVPNYYCSEFVNKGDFVLKPGTVIAVEPMVNAGTKRVRMLGDHWTIITSDRKLSAHFEHTLAITASGVKILTGPPATENEKIDISPYILL